MHFVLNREGRRIQVAKQSVTDRRLLLYDRLQFAYVNFRFRYGLQQPQTIEAISGYFFRVKNFGTAKK